MNAAAALLLAVLPTAGAGLRPLARDFASSASRHGVTRVAVATFAPSDASPAADGPILAERLLGELVRGGRVTAIERTRMSGLIDEQALGRSGALRPEGVRRRGRLLAADALVVGSFTTHEGRVRLQARLVDAETGAIVAAGEATLARDWTAGGGDCSRQRERGYARDRSTLELKARLWSRRLREGQSFSDAASTPGLEMADEELRWAFYDRVAELYASGEAQALSTAEFADLTKAESEALSDAAACASR